MTKYEHIVPAVGGKPVYEIKRRKLKKKTRGGKVKEVDETIFSWTSYGDKIVFVSNVKHEELEGKSGVIIKEVE